MRETQNIEYKTIWKDEYLKWICGFANAQGGIIYIGKDDDGNVVGVNDLKKLSEDIPNKVRDVLGIMVDVNIYEDNGVEYLEINVPPYTNPINYKGQYHYRSGSTKQELKGEALNRFILRRSGKNWDETPIKGLSIDELSEYALNRFRKEAAKSNRVDENVLNDSTEILLEDLRLIDKETGCLSIAAVLLFHPEPEKYVRGAYIKIGFFRSDNEDLAFQDEIHPSKPYNPSVANVLFRCGDIESWGRGYKRIIDAVSSYKMLPPIVEIISGLMITYYADIKSQLKAQKIDEKYFPIIEFVVKNGSITNSDVQKLLNTSKATAYRMLSQLSDWLEINGVTGKGTYYTFKGLTKGSK